MKRNLLVGTALSLTLIGGTASLLAHHSAASAYDTEKKVTFKGTVTKLDWKNPHVFTYIDVVDESGKVTNWACEMGSPNGLTRQGWTRNTLKVGMVISFDGTRAKDGSNRANARNVLVDGKKLGAASSEAVTP